jgi:hypothetical protein
MGVWTRTRRAATVLSVTGADDGGDSPPTDAHWGSRVAATVGRQVAHYRDRRNKMSARELSEATEALGYAVTRSNIANLESGRRPSVSVPEVIVLARALDIPVVALLLPIGTQPTTEILPGRDVSTEVALAWLAAERDLDGMALDLNDPSVLAVTNTREHADRVRRLQAARRETDPRHGGGAGIYQLASLVTAHYALALVRAGMRDRGDVPPALPDDLGWVDSTPPQRLPEPDGTAERDDLIHASLPDWVRTAAGPA